MKSPGSAMRHNERSFYEDDSLDEGDFSSSSSSRGRRAYNPTFIVGAPPSSLANSAVYRDRSKSPSSFQKGDHSRSRSRSNSPSHSPHVRFPSEYKDKYNDNGNSGRSGSTSVGFVFGDKDKMSSKEFNSSIIKDGEKDNLISFMNEEIERLKKKVNTIVESAEKSLEEAIVAQEGLRTDYHGRLAKKTEQVDQLSAENAGLKGLVAKLQAELEFERGQVARGLRFVDRMKSSGRNSHAVVAAEHSKHGF